MYVNGVTYDTNTASTSTDGKEALGIRVKKEKWDNSYFTVTDRDKYIRSGLRMKPYKYETGQIVVIKKKKSQPYKCPYRVTKMYEDDSSFLIVLKSCRSGSDKIVFQSTKKTKHDWNISKGETNYPRYGFSIMPVVDSVLVKELDATEAYVAGSV